MLYISQRICDNLPEDILWRLSKLSVEKQTLFECLYYRFSSETIENKVILYVLLDGVQECIFVK